MFHPVYVNPYYHYPNPRPIEVSTYYRTYPDVDPTQFKKSAESFQRLMNDASQIFERLAQSEEFAFEVMQAAQVDDVQRVQELVESTGVHGNVDIDYNPDGLTLEMHSQVEGSDCCILTMVIRW